MLVTSAPKAKLRHASIVLLAGVAFILVAAHGSQAQGPTAYEDPTTGTDVLRITDDGPNGCVSYMGNLSGEAVSWSPDSSRIVYAKYCEDESARTGIHVYDLPTRTETCIAVADKHWAHPIFDHDGDTVYFVNGSDGARDDAGAKPYVVRTVAVPDVLSGNDNCPSAATTLIDVRAETNSTAEGTTVLTKNTATQTADELFAVQIRVDGQWRTVVFGPDGQTEPNWGFDDATNPTHDDYNDGDASIWSPVDPYQIFTNRGTSANDATVRRGVWTIDSPTLLYSPFPYDPECSGDYRPSTSVAHSDWTYHAATDTQVFASSDRCVWSIDGDGNTAISPWRLHGYLHVQFDTTSTGGDLGDIRFVADEYFDGYGAEPFLYSATLADVGFGGDAIGRWSDIRRERKLVGHRNRMDDGSSTSLKAYEPHPQFSPDGRYVLWQSSSLNQVLNHTCPVALCGPAGQGSDSRIGYLDLYVAELDGAGPAPGITSPVEGSTLDCSEVEISWADTADEYWLYAGPELGSFRYYNSGPLGGTPSTIVSGLPSDGSTVHVRLWSRDAGSDWSWIDATYQACSSLEARIDSPSAGATLDCAGQSLSWSGSADEYWVYAGPTAGARAYFNSGPLGGATNTVMTGLPVDGSDVSVRLWYRPTGASWSWVDITYVACSQAGPSFIAEQGSLLCEGQALGWSGTSDEYWVYVGPTVGSRTWLDSGSLGSATSVTISGLPDDGSAVHVRLWHRATNARWAYVDGAFAGCGG